MIDDVKIMNEIKYLKIAIDKTAGARKLKHGNGLCQKLINTLKNKYDKYFNKHKKYT